MSKHDALSAKRRRTERYRFEVSDPTQAVQDLTAARREAVRARDTDAEEQAEQRVKAAEAAVEACYASITLQALPARRQLEFQQEQAEAQAVRDRARAAVVKAAQDAGEEPPPEEDEPEPEWGPESFEVRLIAACDADGRSPATWAEALSGDDWSLQERNELLAVALSVNTTRRWDFNVLGKG